jgi:hypothetical protein
MKFWILVPTHMNMHTRTHIHRDRQCSFQCNGWITDQNFCYCFTVEKKWKNGNTLRQYIAVCTLPENLCMIQWGVGVLVQLSRLTKMCLNGACSKAHIGRHLPPIQNGLKQGYDLLPLLFIFSSEYTRWDWNWMGHISCWSMLMM